MFGTKGYQVEPISVEIEFRSCILKVAEKVFFFFFLLYERPIYFNNRLLFSRPEPFLPFSFEGGESIETGGFLY